MGNYKEGSLPRPNALINFLPHKEMFRKTLTSAVTAMRTR